MKKQKNYLFWVIISSVILFAGIIFGIWISRFLHTTKELNSYTNAYTAENVYKWLVGSKLIDPKLKKLKVEKEFLSDDSKNLIMLENQLMITEFNYNREEKLKKDEQEQESVNSISPPPPAHMITVKNITVRLPYGSGNPYDVQKVLKSRKALPRLSKTYPSNKAEEAIMEFKKKNRFASFVEAFNQIENERLASNTYSEYLENQPVTWTGEVIEVERKGGFSTVYLHGKPSIYHGEFMNDINGALRDRQPDIDVLPYVFSFWGKDDSLTKKMQKGDLVTIKGNLSGYAYQPHDANSIWSIDGETIKIEKVKKTTQSYRAIDPLKAYEVLNIRQLFPSPHFSSFSQTKKNGKYTTVINTDRNRMTLISYPYNREKKIGSNYKKKNGGTEFTVGNITIWVRNGEGNPKEIKKVLMEY